MPEPAHQFYFERLGLQSYRPTELVQGAWDLASQHVAPAFGLLAHAVEEHLAARRPDALAIGRISYDILGPISIDPVGIEITLLRPGKTIELVEARIVQNGRAAIIARAWLMRAYDTQNIAGSAFQEITPPDQMAPWNLASIWAGKCVTTVEVRRRELGAGRATSWVRTDVMLLKGEVSSPTARALGILDMANGLATRVAPQGAAFPNLDLTVHLARSPEGEWLGLDTSVSFGPSGIGLTHSIIHDAQGPVGSVAQTLTVRPRPDTL